MRRRTRTTSRMGLTLIEVLVVIIIVAVLASLILPGILLVRRGPHRAGCLNNMRNIGVALLQYTTEWNCFPASGYWDVPDANGDGKLDESDLLDPETGWNFTSHKTGVKTAAELQHGMRYSWCVDVLSYLEHSDIHDVWDFSESTGARGAYNNNQAGTGKRPTGDNPNTGVSGLASTSIEVFTCPDDITTEANRGNLSYVVNGGFSFHWLVDNDGKRLVGGKGEVGQRVRDNRFRMGLMFLEPKNPGNIPIRRHSVKTVKDGVTTTVMLSENANAGYIPETDWPTSWACPHPFNTSFFVNGVAVGVDRTTAEKPYDLTKANNAGDKAPPLVMDGVEGGINGDLSGYNDSRFPYPNGFHTGGVHIVRCDGSVRFIREDIDPDVWARLVTPDGGSLVRPSDGQPQPEERGIGYTQQTPTESEIW